VTSLQQEARERGQRPQQVVRSIAFRLAQDVFIMALVAGRPQISWRRLRRYRGVRRLTMATEDEVLRVTGLQIGTVGPFGLRGPLRVLIADRLPHLGQRLIGSGLEGTAIILDAADVLKAWRNPDAVNLTNGT
jgi:Cys-tRNA(Pro)/Cys-tRNA(Cys) deacylase